MDRQQRPAKKKVLTVKERKLIKGLAHGKSLGEAALAANYGRGANRASASASASRALKNVIVSKALDEYMAKVGMSTERELTKINDALDAKKVQFFAEKGVVKDSRVVVDHGTRLQAAELALRLRGHLSHSKDQSENNGVNVTAIVISLREACVKRGLPIPVEPYKGAG